MRKNYFICLGASLTLIPSMGSMSIVTSCSGQKYAKYWTESQKITIDSLQQCDDKLWIIDNQTTLKLNNVIDAFQTNYPKIIKSIHDVVLPESPYCMEERQKPMPTSSLFDSYNSPGRTSFSMIHKNSDQSEENIVGKNYDWFLNDCFGLVVKNNAPDVKNKSIGFFSSLGIDLPCAFKLNTENKERFLYTPYTIVEGMNDKGLAVTSLLIHSGANHMNQCEPGKPILPSLFVPQILLSNCDNVQECVEELDNYNLQAYAGVDEKDNSYQWLVADKEHWMLITYINNQIVTYSNLNSNERRNLAGGEVLNKPTRICNVDFIDLPESEEDKDPVCHPNFWEYGSTLLPDDDSSRIEINTPYMLGTNFYENILDEELQDNPQPRFRHYPTPTSQELSTYFNCNDNGFWRYCKCRDILKQYAQAGNGPSTEQAMDVLKQCAYCLNDGDIRALRWKRKLPFKNREDWTGLTMFSLVFNTAKLTADLCLFENYDKVYHFNLKN